MSTTERFVTVKELPKSSCTAPPEPIEELHGQRAVEPEFGLDRVDHHGVGGPRHRIVRWPPCAPGRPARTTTAA